MGPMDLTLTLLKRITNDFSEEQKLGAGSFGKVYLGKFDNGQRIAVKLLYSYGPEYDNEQFQNEFGNLMKLEHPNIVRLMGYCYEIKPVPVPYQGTTVFAEKSTRALCLEYLQNGSLEWHLSNGKLDWHTRYSIIKGICEGLKYMHWGVKPPVLHLDLKPDNILLDENMVPKLADFGLSRICNQGTQITSSCIGTLGYQPPEYLNSSSISKEFDIYSLGMVMRKIIEAGHESEKCIDTVQRNWRSKLDDGTYDGILLDAYCRQVKTCTEIALKCINHEKQKRPNILEILDMLNVMENELDVLKNNQVSHMEKLQEPLMVKPANDEGQGGEKVASGETISRTPSYSYTTTIGSTGLTLRVLKGITDSFSEDRKIGTGSFGKVYLGDYENGKRIAVKILDYDKLGPDAEQFQKEFDRLMKLEHPNIVRLIDYCYETQYEAVPYRGRLVMIAKTTRALCLEYLHNGNLEKHLSNEQLEWHTWYKIIKGICEGLRYIHMKCEALHLNIKPNNVLLDEHMVPKLADLGLSEIFNGCFATRGYQPPEYKEKRLISKEFDIFSLGVVILRILTGAGRKGTYSRDLGIPPEQFVDAVERDWRSRLEDNQTSDGFSLDAHCRQVRLCTEIALMCTEHERIRRPNIVQIVKMLDEMENKPCPPPPPPLPCAPEESKIHTYERPEETNTEVRSGAKSELLSVHPLLLQFPLKPSNSPISWRLHLRNNTDDHVVFRLRSKRPIRDFEGPTCGVVAPRSRLNFTVTLRRQLNRGEYFELLSTRAGGQALLKQDAQALDFLYRHCSFINRAKEAGYEVHSVTLPTAVYTQTFSAATLWHSIVDGLWALASRLWPCGI